MAALTETQKNLVRQSFGLIRNFAQSSEYEQWRIANQRLNGSENLKALALADVKAMDPQLADMTQQQWDDVSAIVGGITTAIDGHFASASYVVGTTI